MERNIQREIELNEMCNLSDYQPQGEIQIDRQPGMERDIQREIELNEATSLNVRYRYLERQIDRDCEIYTKRLNEMCNISGY